MKRKTRRDRSRPRKSKLLAPLTEELQREKVKELLGNGKRKDVANILRRHPEHVATVAGFLLSRDFSWKQIFAAEALERAVKKGADISEAVPALRKKMDSRHYDVRAACLKALGAIAVKNDEALHEVLSGLLDDGKKSTTLRAPGMSVREDAEEILIGLSMENPRRLVEGIARFVNAEEFLRAAEKNTSAFQFWVEATGKIVAKIARREAA